MTRTYEASGDVVFCGFAESLEQVYRPGSILLLARSVRGGIKTKILEAFEHGVPTIGTPSAFEGFEGEYPWRVDEAYLRRLVGDQAALRETYQKAVSVGSEIFLRQFSRQHYARALSDYVHKRTGPTEQASSGSANRDKLAASLG
jgi:glycosyltransferase involved in cell wall biosynthesis